MKTVSFRLDDETIEYLQKLSVTSGHKRSEIIRMAILNQKIDFSGRKKLNMYMKNLYKLEEIRNIMMEIFDSLESESRIILSNKIEKIIILLSKIENDL